jgi:hypothetical protein
MAAGCIVVMPDVGGNRAYADFGVNAMEVRHDDIDSYLAAIRTIEAMDPDDVGTMRESAYRVLEAHTIDRERAEFVRYMAELDQLTAV